MDNPEIPETLVTQDTEQVLSKGKLFLLVVKHQSCYSYVQDIHRQYSERKVYECNVFGDAIIIYVNDNL
jgi:hypothetical protein